MNLLEQRAERPSLLSESYVQEVLYPEFYECNENYEDDLIRVLTTPRTRRTKSNSLGYTVWKEESSSYEPIPELLCKVIKLLYEFRYKGSRSLRESLELIQQYCDKHEDAGFIESQGGLSLVFTKLEGTLNLRVKETSSERIKKIREERRIKRVKEGKKGFFNYSTENKKKVAKKKVITRVQKELRILQKRKSALRMKAARAARSLQISGDPLKGGIDPTLSFDSLFDCVKEKRNSARMAVPNIIIKDNLIDTYNEMLSTNVDEVECMRVYQEIILGEHKYDERKVAFLPTPRQYKFLSAPENLVLYGGAAGGGKSYSLILDPLRFVHCRDHNVVIIRRTMPELRQLIDISLELYDMLTPKPKWMAGENTWKFPSGAKIWFSFMETAKDKLRYQGQDYTYVGFDELSQYPTDEGFAWLMSRTRKPVRAKEIQTYIRATANPGSQWVYDRFIAPAPPETTFIYPPSIGTSKPRTAKFIPAKLADNPHLDYDGEYRAMLESLPEVERRQLLDGDWMASNDAMFTEFSIETHVCEPFYIPKHWNRVCGLDYGYNDPAAAVWFAVNPEDGCLIVYDELIETGLTGREFASAIKAREAEELVYVDHPVDYSVYAKTGHTGPSIAESMISVPGFRMRPADKSRESGWLQIHEHLRANPKTGTPRLMIFNTCVNTVRQLSGAKKDLNKPMDLNQTRTSDGHWDALDALRYGVMSRPRVETLDERLVRFKEPSKWDRVNNYFSF
jgi:hypothetical protein